MMNEIVEEFGERATIVVIPNASHALMPEQPVAVTDAILQWIGRLRSSLDEPAARTKRTSEPPH
jgi:hypothetical protein